jgi:hypothetical protein
VKTIGDAEKVKRQDLQHRKGKGSCRLNLLDVPGCGFQPKTWKKKKSRPSLVAVASLEGIRSSAPLLLSTRSRDSLQTHLRKSEFFFKVSNER